MKNEFCYSQFVVLLVPEAMFLVSGFHSKAFHREPAGLPWKRGSFDHAPGVTREFLKQEVPKRSWVCSKPSNLRQSPIQPGHYDEWRIHTGGFQPANQGHTPLTPTHRPTALQRVSTAGSGVL